MILLHPYLLLLLPFLLLLTFGLRRPNRNLPPGPRPLPIIGNLFSIRGIRHLSFHRLSQKYGPILYLKLGQVPTVIISGADMASEILKSQDHVFCTRSQVTVLKKLSYGGKDLAFCPYDDHWRQVRRLCNAELFSLSRVQAFNYIRKEEVNALIVTISRACSRREAINLTDIIFCFFNNIIYREVFGKRLTDDGDCGSSPLQDMLRDLSSLMSEFGAADMFPSMGWIDEFTGLRRKLDKNFEKMNLMFEEKITKRMLTKKYEEDDSQHEDFLDVLLHLHTNNKKDYTFTMNTIKAILMDTFTAGTDTSAASVEWGMAHLMKNPEAMKRAQAEIRRVVGDKGKVEESDLQHLHYLKMVIKEVFRLNPPGPLLPPRDCMKDTRIGNYDIPANTRVHVNVWSIGRDPKYWGDDTEVFRPERFENNPISFKGTHFELIPFGGGRRICPGMSLAMVSVELLYASILYGFDWFLPDGMMEEDIDMRVKSGIVTPKKVPLILMATPTFIKD